MKAYFEFCDANNLNRDSRHSRKAFEDSLKGPGGPKRAYEAKVLILCAKGTTAEGDTLLRFASGIESRDRFQTAENLRYLMETEDGCEGIEVAEWTPIPQTK